MPFLRLTDDQVATRKRRNLWLALGLVAFMVLVFLTTFLRLQQNLDDRKALHQAAVAEAAARADARP